MTPKEYRNGTWLLKLAGIILFFGFMTPLLFIPFFIYYAFYTENIIFATMFVVFAICVFIIGFHSFKKLEYVEKNYKFLVRNLNTYKNNPIEVEKIINKEKESWLYRHIEWNE